MVIHWKLLDLSASSIIPYDLLVGASKQWEAFSYINVLQVVPFPCVWVVQISVLSGFCIHILKTKILYQEKQIFVICVLCIWYANEESLHVYSFCIIYASAKHGKVQSTMYFAEILLSYHLQSYSVPFWFFFIHIQDCFFFFN